ncbi:MAG: putative RNA-binding protein with RPS1 domain [Phycisphaerales bacterium]|jgi:predicted RNA-binding protein with RPS1 domain
MQTDNQPTNTSPSTPPQPAAEPVAAEQPVAEQPAAEQPAAEQPVAPQPVAEQPSAPQATPPAAPSGPQAMPSVTHAAPASLEGTKLQAARPKPQPEAAKPEAPAKLDDTTLAEIDAAMQDMEAANKAEAGAPHKKKAKVRGPRVVQGGREHRTGTVVSVGASDIFVEFGPKELGVVDAQQYADALPAVGDQLEVVVQKYETSDSIYICAKPGTVQKADWEMLQAGQTVEARVVGVNKGGLECEVAGHEAFMPASQVDINHIADLSVFVGEKLPCLVQRVDKRGKGSIVLSRREVIQADRAKLADEMKGKLAVGDTMEGVVRKIMDFGAFIDLGGIDGLVHISDIAHERINHGAKNIARHIEEGQKVSVKILKLEWEAGRISLGLKQLSADTFQTVASEIQEGAVVSGKVTKLADFGCFIEVAPGIEGLCHISELEWRRVEKVSDCVQPGEIVQVLVLKVDSSDRKISLSIKQTKEAPAAPRGGGGAKGRGRGRGDRDDRDPAEILKETPELRRLREKASKTAKKQPKRSDGGGLGTGGGLGLGLGDLKF